MNILKKIQFDKYPKIVYNKNRKGGENMKEKILSLFRTALEKFRKIRKTDSVQNQKKFKILHNSLTGCQISAFEKSITVPNGIQSIGGAAFYNCRNVEQIILPDGVKTIGSSAFAGCRSLKSVVLPESVSWIGESAFMDCEQLTDIHLPENLKIISKHMFKGCRSLKSIRIPEHSQMKDGAFEDCTGLETVSMPTSGDIPSFFFYRCENLKNIEIPSVSGRIGTEAFRDCKNLKNIVLPSRIQMISENAFKGSGLTGIQIPENMLFVGAGAFSDCKALQYAVIPSTIQSMGTGVFSRCEKLERVRMAEGIEEIFPEMFFDCQNLKGIEIPYGVKKISQKAFMDCITLSVVRIPKTVMQVSYTAFVMCHQLRSILWGGLHFQIETLYATGLFSAPFDTVSSIASALAPLNQKSEDYLHDEKTAAVYGSLFRQYLTNPEEKALSAYILNHLHVMLCSLIAVRNTVLLQELLTQNLLFTRENLPELILYANQEQAYEIQVMLAEHQHRHFAPESIAETVRKKFDL